MLARVVTAGGWRRYASEWIRVDARYPSLPLEVAGGVRLDRNMTRSAYTAESRAYTTEGAKGVLKGGGSARRAAAQQTIEIVDGTREAFYFAFGEDDVFVILEAPDNVRLMETCNFEGEQSMEATMMTAFSANGYARRFIPT